jgi:hypothetical protein
MKKALIIGLILASFSLPAAADMIIFKDGMRIDAPHVWETNGEVMCEIGGIVFGYPKSDVERVVKDSSTQKKEATPVRIVGDRVIEAPEKQDVSRSDPKPALKKIPSISQHKQAASQKKKVISKTEQAAPGKKTLPPKREISELKKPATVMLSAPPALKKEKKASQKHISTPKKTPVKKAAASQPARIPSFKMIINEDDSNPPAYIKRRRVLLVDPGLAKPQIRALLLSYEKTLRKELSAQQANYKTIIVWAYDDYKKADEGAAGWAGMITNKQKSGILSDNPELRIK